MCVCACLCVSVPVYASSGRQRMGGLARVKHDISSTLKPWGQSTSFPSLPFYLVKRGEIYKECCTVCVETSFCPSSLLTCVYSS